MDNQIKQIVNEYERNKNKAIKHNSYINDVREYKGYIFKEITDLEKLKNEEKWLKKLIDFNYNVPTMIGTHNQTIIIQKIDGQSIKDNEAHNHLYNIGQLMAKLHNLPIEQNIDWKRIILSEYMELKESVKGIMEINVFEESTKFLEQELEDITVSKIAIIHRDIRPENIMYSKGEYYLLDLESMSVGDIDYDFTRMLNLLNQKETYQYEDLKNFINGYKSINNLELSKEKWQLYNKFYAFRMYSKILTGKINRDSEFEEYLKNILLTKYDRVAEWIKKLNRNI